MDYLLKLATEYGDIAYFPLTKIQAVFVNHPKLIHEVLVKQFEAFPKMGRQRKVIRQIDGNSVFVKQGEQWQNDRRVIQSFFRPNRMGEYAAKSVAAVKRRTDNWNDDSVINFEDETIELSVEILGSLLFNADLRSHSAVIRKAVHVRSQLFMNEMRALIPLPDSWPLPSKKKKKWFKETMDKLIYEMIYERRREGLQNDDMISGLLKIAPDTSEGNRQARDHLNMMLQAAADDISSAMVWLFYLIARNPETQIKLKKEIAHVTGGRDVTLQDLSQLSFLHNVVSESLRLYPSTWMFTTRKARRDVKVGDYQIKHRTWVMISPFVTHRDGRFFEQPNEFHPDRFSKSWRGLHNAQAYFPFGMGPRACAAGKFSLMKLALTAATILQKFHLELEPGQENMDAVPLVTVRPKSSVRIRVHRVATMNARVA